MDHIAETAIGRDELAHDRAADRLWKRDAYRSRDVRHRARPQDLARDDGFARAHHASRLDERRRDPLEARVREEEDQEEDDARDEGDLRPEPDPEPDHEHRR